MSVAKAKAHYLGRDGHMKLNCAQSIVGAYREKFSAPQDDMLDQFARYGGGRAPGGECGSLYAAMILLDKSHPARLKACEEVLRHHAGSTKCKEIRALGRLSCVGCVEKVAEYLEDISF